jgi:cell wall assembly regulator SMI1
MNADDTQLQQALQRIDTWFARHRPRFHAGLNPGAAAAELEGLPDELRVMLSWHNGQSGDFVGCFRDNWFLMSAAEIRAAGANIKGRIPFLDDDAGNLMCLNTTKSPAPVWAYYLDDTTAGIEAPSLMAWMFAFAEELEAGHYVEDPERGRLIRKSK